jgi:hypothetical protein
MGIYRGSPQTWVYSNEQKSEFLGKHIINRLPIVRSQLALGRSSTFYVFVPLRHNLEIVGVLKSSVFRRSSTFAHVTR